jgi:lipopolysaccharide export LptBFGC system permease protein LptF
VKQKLQFYERLFIGLESVIFIIMSFYAGFELCRSHNILWFCLFIGILFGKFKWESIKEVTKRIVL